MGSIPNIGSVITASNIGSDDLLDLNQWEQWTYQGAKVIQGPSLMMSTSADYNVSMGGIRSPFQFATDFDVQVDYRADAGWDDPVTPPGGLIWVANIRVYVDDINWVQISHLVSPKGQASVAWDSSKGELLTWEDCPNVYSGKLRIIRTDSDYEFLVDTGSGWHRLGLWSNLLDSTKLVSIDIVVYSDYSKNAFSTYFENFKINSSGNVDVVKFVFDEVGLPPNGDQRYLAVSFFSYIDFIDKDLNTLKRIQLGTLESRGMMGVGWFGDERDENNTWVWTGGLDKYAVLYTEIPPAASFLRLSLLPLLSNNPMQIIINGEVVNTVIPNEGLNEYTISLVAQAAQSEVYSFIKKWGSFGHGGDSQFGWPASMALDSYGNLYIVDGDPADSCIRKYSSSEKYITKWGGPGSGDGQFNGPEGIAIDKSGNIFVADRENSRIQKFTSNGLFLSKFGGLGMMDGQFNGPHGVAIDGSGNIYVVDSNNYRIQKFTSAGVFILKWGQKGSQDGQFYNPTGIVVDKSGYVYVSDSGNHRVQKFTSDGVFLTKWGSLGSGISQFDNPTCLALDGSGNIFVVDNYSDYVQKFTPSGNFITKIGEPGFDDGQFDAPYGIAVTDSGYVYISDLMIRRIQKFAPNTSTTIPTKYTLTTLKNGEGSVVLDKTGPYDANTVVQLTAVSNNGWAFSQWSGDASGTSSTTTLIMNSDKTVTATFTRVIVEDALPPTVSLELPVNGGICWTGDILVSGLYSDNIGIDKESVNLSIDGVNATHGLYVGKDLIMYHVSLSLGIHVAQVTVEDLGRNVATATTSFTVIPLEFLVIPVIIMAAVIVILIIRMNRKRNNS